MAIDSPGRAWVALNSPVWPIGIACVAVAAAAIGGSSSSYTPYVSKPAWTEGGESSSIEVSERTDLPDLGSPLAYVFYFDPLGRFAFRHPAGWSVTGATSLPLMASGGDPTGTFGLDVGWSAVAIFTTAEQFASRVEDQIRANWTAYRRLSYGSATLAGGYAAQITGTYLSGGVPMKRIWRFTVRGMNGYWMSVGAPAAIFDGCEAGLTAILDSLVIN